MDKGCLEAVLMFVVISVLALAFSLLYAYFGVILWNYAVTAIFGLPEITYWQMFALMVLVRLFVVPIKYDFKND